MSEEQQTMINHVADLDRKISSTRFNLDQLSVGREAFMKLLTEQLDVDEEVEEES
jgi:flagellar hook assembly protein FlgD